MYIRAHRRGERPADWLCKMVPTEIWVQILAYVPTNELPKIRQLSKYFQQMANDNLKQRIKNDQMLLRLSHEPKLVDIGPDGDPDFVQPSDVVTYDCSRFKIIDDTVMILATPQIQRVLEYFTPKFDEGYCNLFGNTTLFPVSEQVDYDLADDVLHGEGPRHFHDKWCFQAESAILGWTDDRFNKLEYLSVIYDDIAHGIFDEVLEDASLLEYWDGSNVWENSTSKVVNKTTLRLKDASGQIIASVSPPVLQQNATRVWRDFTITAEKADLGDFYTETVWRVWENGHESYASGIVSECLAIRLRVPIWTAIRLLV